MKSFANLDHMLMLGAPEFNAYLKQVLQEDAQPAGSAKRSTQPADKRTSSEGRELRDAEEKDVRRQSESQVAANATHKGFSAGEAFALRSTEA